MSLSSPPPVASVSATSEQVTPYGRPVRRRIAVPLILSIGLVLAGVAFALHDRVVYFRVDSDSMQPTLSVGTRVAIEPGLRPRVGEIVVFHPPRGAIPATPICGMAGQGAGSVAPCGLPTVGSSRAIFIKRIVAGPGDSVRLEDGRAVVNGVLRTEPFAAACNAQNCTFPTAVRVPAGDYYMLGDNRGASDDSRFWGPVPASSILGVLVSCAPLQTDCQPRG